MNLENFYNLRTKHIKRFKTNLRATDGIKERPNLTLEIQNQISLLNYSLRQLSQDFSKGGGGHPVKQSVLTRFPCRLLCHMLPKKAYKGGGGNTGASATSFPGYTQGMPPKNSKEKGNATRYSACMQPVPNMRFVFEKSLTVSPISSSQ